MFKKIIAWFKNRNVETEIPAEIVDLEINSSPESSYFEKPEIVPSENEDVLPLWLSDEGILRDEGVIFGLSDSTVEEKISVIKSIYARQSANLEKMVQLHSERIGEINLSIETCENKLAKNISEQDEIVSIQNQKHNLLKTSISLILAVFMSFGNFYLIDFVVKNVFSLNHVEISTGIFFAGMFSIFSPVSFLFKGSAEKPVLRMIEEIGIPFFAAFLIFALAYDKMPFIQVAGISIFVFMIFLFSGKIALQNLTLIQEDLAIFRSNLSNARLKGKVINELKKEVEMLENEIDNFRKDKWKIIPELSRQESELNKIHAQCEAQINIFESEFKLARSYKGSLTGKEIKQIIE